jgi:hypothetical protein
VTAAVANVIVARGKGAVLVLATERDDASLASAVMVRSSSLAFVALGMRDVTPLFRVATVKRRGWIRRAVDALSPGQVDSPEISDLDAGEFIRAQDG